MDDKRTPQEAAIACGVNRQKIHRIENWASQKLGAGFAARGILEIASGLRTRSPGNEDRQ
jgi:hypothetical protein